MDENRICLDTSMLIGYLRGQEPAATAVERAVRNSICYVTAITVYELLFGMARARRQIGGENALLNMMLVASFDDRAARRAARLHAELLRNNREIGIKDTLIAATCLEYGLPLLTLNDRHFVHVPGLQIVTPTEFLAS
jgi:tRNA(fMet)-specific endonuclease VapC